MTTQHLRLRPPPRPARLPGVRAQLTAISVAVFAGLTLAGGVIFYQAVRATLASGFDAELKIHTDQIASGVSLASDGTIQVADVTGELPDLDTPTPTDTPTPDPNQPTATPDAGQPTATPDPNQPTATAMPGQAQITTATDAAMRFGPLVRVLDAQGMVVYHSPAFTVLAPPAISVTQPARGRAWSGTVTARNGQDVRLYSEPLFADDGSVFAIVQVGEALTALNATLQSVLLLLLIVFPAVLLADVILSYWLAGRAIRPIARLTHTAQEIEGGDLRQRVPVPATNDEVRRLALTFNTMLDRLEGSFIRQRRFVADASHELRTPVAAIRSMSEVAMTQAATPEEYAAVLHNIVAEAERLGGLISDLLLLARADEGQTTLTRERMRLDLLVEDVLATAVPRAESRGIALVAHLESVTLNADEARLIQVVMNLIDNALTYTDAGGTVTVTTVADPDMARLSVADTGIGIAPADLPHIFERFYRADAARSRGAGGAGLGLALVRWVVRAHGGDIEVASTPGGGTTFTVALPYNYQES